jgi:uncharacterized LabA/DUF88 family protein
MSRVAVFVDAGYLFAQGSVLLAGKKLTRGEITLDHGAAAEALAHFSRELTGVDLLRVYWYDGTSTGPTAQHLTLAHLDNVKVRLGFVNSVGEQKGVDSLIVTDMIALARNRAISDAVLVSGDEDLRVGVQQAQEFGVRVHLVGIKPSRGSQSLFLLQEADTTHEWSDHEISKFLICKPRPKPLLQTALLPSATAPAGASAAGAPALESLVAKVVASVDQGVLEALIENFEGAGQLPRDLDRQLLAGGRSALGRDLDPTEKKRVRASFVEACRRRMTS